MVELPLSPSRMMTEYKNWDMTQIITKNFDVFCLFEHLISGDVNSFR